MNQETNDFSTPATPTTPSTSTPAKNNQWERATLEKLVFANLNEQRAKRRWNIFFRLAFLLLFAAVVARMYGLDSMKMDEGREKLTGLVKIHGEIAAGASGSAAAVVPALVDAFEDERTVGVILQIDTPGGSPVQASIIHDEMVRLRKAYPKKPLYVVVDDMCASAGYFIASGADKIYVNQASIVGSIGVLMDSFGFTGLMEKAGIERRLMTAGENKASLDPFSPQNAKDKAHAQSLLNELHQQFIGVVRAGRGKRLKETPEMFSGQYWTGARAVEMGLADGFGTSKSVARELLKAEDLVDYTHHEDFAERLMRNVGASFLGGVSEQLRSEARLRLH